jgi:O-antigen/teichoic acid export membrane protein
MKSVVFSLYAVQVYSILVTVTATPFLILHLGAEGYGLIGLYFILQMLLQVIDGGLTGTITKLAATLNRHNQSSVEFFYKSFWHFKKIIKKNIITITCVSLLLYFFNVFPRFIDSSFADNTISNCILLMLLCVSVRFFSLADRGFLQGIEKQKPIAVSNFISVTLRYPVAVLIVAIFDNDITLFFLFQLVVVLVEILLLRLYSLHYFKKLNIPHSESWRKKNEGSQFKLLISDSNSLWSISIFWVLASQLDKLVLSAAISLEDFGVFSLALVAANLMLTMFIPINQVLMPRFVKLNAKDDQSELVRNALNSIQLYVCFFFGRYNRLDIFWR